LALSFDEEDYTWLYCFTLTGFHHSTRIIVDVIFCLKPGIEPAILENVAAQRLIIS